MKKRIFSLLLCLTLLCALLPASAWAVTNVNKVTAWVAAPLGGGHPSAPYLNSSDKKIATLDSYEWRDAEADKKLSAEDTFVIGKTYRLTVQCSAQSGYAFTNKASASVNYKKNGIWTYRSATVVERAESGITFYRDLVAFGPDIEAVAVTVTPPEAGALPSFQASESDPHHRVYTEFKSEYYSNGVNWFDMTYDPSKDPAGSMNLSGASFEAGKSYRVCVALYPEAGYEFAKDIQGEPTVSVTVNGKTSTVKTSADPYSNAIIIRYDFPALGGLLECDFVQIGIEQPRAGETPDFAPVLPGNAALVTDYPAEGYIGGVRWRDATTHTYLGPDDVFIEGHEYTLRLALQAVGCVFKNDGVDTEVSYTVNGGEEQIAGNLTATGYDDPDKYLSISWTFTAAASQIKTVQAAALSLGVPAFGQTPDQNPVLTAEGVKLSYFEWREYDSGNKPVLALNKTDTFRADTVYGIELTMSPADGYTLKNLTAADVTVNGKQVDDLQHYMDDVVAICRFAPLKTPILSVGAGVTAPKSGDYPSYIFEVLDGACYQDTDKVNGDYWHGVVWYDVTGGGSGTPIGNADKFEAGHTYAVELCVKPNADAVFSVDPQPAVSINGIGAQILEVSGDYLRFQATFPDELTKKPVALMITQPPEKTEYFVGDSFDASNMIATVYYDDGTEATVSDYSVTPDPLEKDDTFVTISYTEGDVTVTATQAITVAQPDRVLQAIAVTTPPDKTVYAVGDVFDPIGMAVTAIYNDESSAVVGEYTWTPDGALTEQDSFITISYTEGDVTVTTELPVQVGEKAENPFLDIQETDYFYDAVMWAYHADPQVTTGIHTDEFGPQSTVTRAQAVTFLWRAMGCPEPETKENPFVDVPETQYFYKAVLWANEKGITTGTDATHFTPNQTCSTAHIITFLYRTITGKTVGGKDWYQLPEAWAEGAGLLDGLSIEVKPGVDCPRSDVVLFLYRKLAK